MELATQADIYTPSVNDRGDFYDSVPSFGNLPAGLRCSCGSRKGKAYLSYTAFTTHTKSKAHAQWLKTLNENKGNLYTQSVRLGDTVNGQKRIIGTLQTQVSRGETEICALQKANENQMKELSDLKAQNIAISHEAQLSHSTIENLNLKVELLEKNKELLEKNKELEMSKMQKEIDTLKTQLKLKKSK
jgi:predicted RNase H-like nuclease (RuvC/YqgF family)